MKFLSISLNLRLLQKGTSVDLENPSHFLNPSLPAKLAHLVCKYDSEKSFGCVNYLFNKGKEVIILWINPMLESF